MSSDSVNARRFEVDRLANSGYNEISVREWLNLGPDRRWHIIALWVNGKTPGITIDEIVEACVLVHTVSRYDSQREVVVEDIKQTMSRMSEQDCSMLRIKLSERGYSDIFKEN